MTSRRHSYRDVLLTRLWHAAVRAQQLAIYPEGDVIVKALRENVIITCSLQGADPGIDGNLQWFNPLDVEITESTGRSVLCDDVTVSQPAGQWYVMTQLWVNRQISVVWWRPYESIDRSVSCYQCVVTSFGQPVGQCFMMSVMMLPSGTSHAAPAAHDSDVALTTPVVPGRDVTPATPVVTFYWIY